MSGELSVAVMGRLTLFCPLCPPMNLRGPSTPLSTIIDLIRTRAHPGCVLSAWSKFLTCHGVACSVFGDCLQHHLEKIRTSAWSKNVILKGTLLDDFHDWNRNIKLMMPIITKKKEAEQLNNCLFYCRSIFLFCDLCYLKPINIGFLKPILVLWERISSNCARSQCSL